MALLILFLVLGVLMIIGLMPGSHNHREWLLTIVLGSFILFTTVYLLILSREQARNAKFAARTSNELKSPRERREDLRRRRLARSRSQSRSRVLGIEPSHRRSGKRHVPQASLRRQDELRISQGIRDAAREQADARQRRGRRVRSDEAQPIGRRYLEGLSRSHPSTSRGRPVSQAGIRRQEELRIAQGRAYAAETGVDAQHITETAGERRKRERLRRRRKRFWRETDWGSSA